MLSYILFSLFLGCIVAVTSFKSETPKSLSPIWLGLGAFVLFSIINYTTMPVLDFWRFDGVWIQIAIASTIGCSVSFLDDTFDGIEVTPVYKMWQAIPLAACILLCVIRIATSAEMFHSSSYKALLKPETVTDTTFTTQIHPIPVDKMISIKREYAEDLASKRIENMPSLGSRCKFGRADMINLNGSFDVKTAEGKYETLTFENEQVWIMPLEHRGLWKWLDNKVTNGYCIVSTHNPNRIFFVSLLMH